MRHVGVLMGIAEDDADSQSAPRESFDKSLSGSDGWRAAMCASIFVLRPAALRRRRWRKS